MTQTMTRGILPALALTLAFTLASPALAEGPDGGKDRGGWAGAHGDMKKFHDGKPRHGKRGPMMDAAEIDKVGAMKPEERRAYFKQKRDAFEKMTPEERKAAHEKRKAGFDKLSEADKEALKKKNKDFHDKMKAERKAYIDSLPPEEREKLKKEHDARRAEMKKKWDNMSDEDKKALKEKRHERMKEKAE